MTDNMSYYSRLRQEWIAETLDIFGFIQRKHLVRKFEISVPQASADIQRFMRDHPGAMEYDPRQKCYVATTTQR